MRSIVTCLLSLAVAAAVWLGCSHMMSVERAAAAEDERAALTPDAAPVLPISDAGSSSLVGPPIIVVPPPCVDAPGKPCPRLDVEADPGSFAKTVWDMSKRSMPAAIVLVMFALLKVARGRWKRLQTGTTGVVSATLLALLTWTAVALIGGLSWSTSLSGALIALITGKALATEAPAVAKGGV